MLSSDEASDLLKGVEVPTGARLGDRAVIAAMSYTFARVGAVVALAVEDYFQEEKRWWLRLREKKRQAERGTLPSQFGGLPRRLH